MARSTNAAAAAEDPSPQTWNQPLPHDSRDDHGILAAFVDDLAQRPTQPKKPRSPSAREEEASSEASLAAFLDLLGDSELVPEEWRKRSWKSSGAACLGRGRRITTYTILLDLVNNRDRPLAEDKFHKYAAFLSDCPAKDLSATLSKLLIAEDERFTESQEEILESACRSEHQRSDLEHWLSILKAPTSEAMVEIFLSRKSFQPSFLLSLILRPSAVFTERSTLVSLLQYTATWYAEGSPPSGKSEVRLFGIIIRLLASHCCRSWPDLLPVVARVVASHIRTGIARIYPQHQVYAKRTTTYNHYLQLFAFVPDRHALRYMAFVWEAQRVLLAMSSELQEPLILERKSFRAIRLVLLGLPKTDEERDAAMRWGRAWPPYKIDRDGLDEQKDPEDEYTRPIKAGITMQESGYAREPIDDVIDILAGTAPDGSPTIQHRANVLKMVKHGHKVGGEEVWATKIRATRNAHEAWLVFQQPPSEWPCRCGPKVYAEMFRKLTAEPANSDHYLPGDGRFAVEVHIPNLSDFEKARRQPPTVERLYKQMREEGIKPSGNLLTVLLESASRFREFDKYLRDSDLDDDLVEWLTGSGEKHVPDISDRLPFGVLQAYVKLLCQRQPRATSRTPPVELRKLIQKAVRLVAEYADSAKRDGRRFIDTRPLWNVILERICQPMGVYFSGRSVSDNFFQTLLLYIDVLREAQKASTPNDDMFLYTAIALRHAIGDQFRKFKKLEDAGQKPSAEWTLWTQLNEARAKAEDEGQASIWDLKKRYAAKEISQLDVIISLGRYLTSRFWDMSRAAPRLVSADGTEYPMPARLYQMRGTEVHVYMQTLGQLGDRRGMIRLLGWIADVWETELRVKDRYHLTRAVACFRVLGDEGMRRMLKRAGIVGGSKEVGEEDDVSTEEEDWAVEEEEAEALEIGARRPASREEGEAEGSSVVAAIEKREGTVSPTDGVDVSRIKERLRGLGAWPDVEQVIKYLGTSTASTEMFEVLLRMDKLGRKNKMKERRNRVK